MALLFCCLNLKAQDPNQKINVWTWHNDNGRTGQNVAETTLKPNNVNKSGFGQLCSYAVDGQVYGQPLVLWDPTNNRNLVYVVTQKDSVYMFDGTNIAPGNQCTLLASDVTGTSTSLLPSGQTAVSCLGIGSKKCDTISPTVGILGTPVIDEKTNHIYLVTYSQDTTPNYYYAIHALNTGLGTGTALQEDKSYNSPWTISSGSFSPAFNSQLHIQRPGLLLLPGTLSSTPYVYIAFSLMDGSTSYPPGFVFRYQGDDFSKAPTVYTTEPDLVNGAGGGVWMDGAGLAAGVDSSGGQTYLYLATADGDFSQENSGNQCKDCGDSFVKLNSGLGMNAGNYFTPCDQGSRWTNPNIGKNPDADFGSGGVMLLPDNLLTSWPYYAISADKAIPGTADGFIYAIPRGSPSGYCANNSPVEILTGTGSYHNSPTFWTTSTNPGAGYLYYASINGPITQYEVQSTCTSGNPPVCNAGGTSTDPSGNILPFPSGTTPVISSNGTTNGILWALSGMSIEGINVGAIYAFDAGTMHHLYDSGECQNHVDNMYSATKFSVPTVANGFVYVGTESANTNQTNLGQGTFYIFGLMTGKTCT